MMGTSGALTSTWALSIPRPANADSRCSTVETRALPLTRVVPSWVSPTFSALAGTSAGGSMSVRRKTMPVSGAAGRNVISTFLPVCRPTPWARMEFLSVRCPSIYLDLPVAKPRAGSAALHPGGDLGRSAGSVSAGYSYELPAHRDPKRGATVTQLPLFSLPDGAGKRGCRAHLRSPRDHAVHHPLLADAAPPACPTRRSLRP